MEQDKPGLIERLGGAAEGDRALDWEIHCRDGLQGVGLYGDHPRYTTSLDAAMTLIPTDGSVNFAEFSWSWEPSDPGVWPAASVRWYPPHKSGPDWHAFTVTAPTPALALCIAALKARNASHDR